MQEKIEHKITYSDILNNIKQTIAEKGIKKKVVAERSGFSEAEFSNILNKRKLIRVEFVPRIAKALDIEIQDIFKESSMRKGI